MLHRTIVLVAFAVMVVATGFAVSRDTSVPPGSFRVAKLRAAVVEMGELASWDYHDTAYGVRLRATVCFEPDAIALESYPLEFQISHYALSESEPESWGRPFRTVADDAHWIVPFGETIGEDGCRDVVVEDLLPDEDYKGLESELGIMSAPPRYARGSCYGVALRIKVSFLANRPVVKDANARAIVRCGSFHPKLDIGR